MTFPFGKDINRAIRAHKVTDWAHDLHFDTCSGENGQGYSLTHCGYGKQIAASDSWWLVTGENNPNSMDSVADADRGSAEMLGPCYSTSDIISNLPANIVNNILICLPLKDAARSSLLAKKWRFRWHHISQLVYVNHHAPYNSYSPQAESVKIYQILLLHRGSLHKFVLFISHLKINASLIDHIILFLTGKDIREFTLHLPDNIRYRVSSTLFQCTRLTDLNIANCVLKFPVEFKGFSRLVKLELHLGHLDDGDLEAFLSKCCLIQQLVLEIRDSGNPLEIDAPNLKFLYFSCQSRSIVFKNVPLLSNVVIANSSARSLGEADNIVEMFGSLPSIEYFEAGRDFLMYLCVGSIPDKLPIMLYRLKSVKMSGFSFSSFKPVYCALLLLRSSPNLQKLELQSYSEPVDSTCTLQILEALIQVKDYFNQLQVLTIEDFRGTVTELEFVSLLLAKSLVLRKIVILPPKHTSDTEVMKILKSLIRLRRASPEAEIIF